MNIIKSNSECNLKYSDEDLVNQLRTGHANAFEVVIRRYNQLLFRAAYGVVANDAIAQEIVQEAYIKAFTNLNTFRSDATLKTWLTRIVINTAISVQRKQHSRINLDSNKNVISFSEIEEVYMQHGESRSNTPEHEVSAEQVKKVLESSLKQLPDKYRSVFVLRVLEEMSVADTAFCLDLTQDVVKTRLSRARTMIKTSFDRHIEGCAKDILEFAGARCNLLTESVMSELNQLGLINCDR